MPRRIMHGPNPYPPDTILGARWECQRQARALGYAVADALVSLAVLLMVGRGDRARWDRPRAALRHRLGRAVFRVSRVLDDE